MATNGVPDEPVDPYAYIGVREWGTAERGYPLTSICHSQRFGWQVALDDPHGGYFYGYGKSPRAAYREADQQRRLKKYGDLAQVVGKMKIAEWLETFWWDQVDVLNGIVHEQREQIFNLEAEIRRRKARLSTRLAKREQIFNLEAEIRGLEHTNAVHLATINQQAARIKELDAIIADVLAGAPIEQARSSAAAEPVSVRQVAQSMTDSS